jgi:hypothetical protein
MASSSAGVNRVSTDVGRIPALGCIHMSGLVSVPVPMCICVCVCVRVCGCSCRSLIFASATEAGNIYSGPTGRPGANRIVSLCGFVFGCVSVYVFVSVNGYVCFCVSVCLSLCLCRCMCLCLCLCMRLCLRLHLCLCPCVRVALSLGRPQVTSRPPIFGYSLCVPTPQSIFGVKLF